MKELTLNDWATSSNKYPDRVKSSSFNSEVKANAEDLLKRVNALLKEIGWDKDVALSSGFRTPESNAKTPGSAKKSFHMSGKALDIVDDKNQTLGKLIRKLQNNQGANGILAKYGLMMEALEATKGRTSNWLHLDTAPRSVRPSMEFKP